MPERIHVLPPELANLIAAGEVVERPASIVKELIENAIDAGAREIRVEITGSGAEAITVTDDGSGMDRDDALLALQRHATSKIRSLVDLTAIHTLGFRGEALPSIAGVSRCTLTTLARGHGIATGTRLQVTGGVVESVDEVGCPEGTTLTIRELFFNTPARRKFLKGERTEFAHIQEIVQRLALAYPERRFRLVHDGRTVVAAHTTAGLLPRVVELFGADIADQLLAVDEGSADLRLTGFCGAPALARPSAARIHSFVNGRPVRDRLFLHAIGEGYRTYVPKGEQPFAILFLTMDPDRVDVNVHPAKAEVRFVNPGAIHRFVANVVRKVLSTIPSGHGLHHPAHVTGLPPNLVGTVSTSHAILGGTSALAHRDWIRQESGALRDAPRGQWQSAGYPASRAQGNAVAVQESLAIYKPHDVGLRPLGQLASTYLVYEGADGTLLLIDQHAAHERIGYEQLKVQHAQGEIARQYLLAPVMVDLTPAQAAAIAEAQDLLAQAGLDCEPFGGATVVVKSVPALLGETNAEVLVREVAADLVAHGQPTALQERIDHLLATVACHRQIRAGDRLETEDLTALVGQMAEGVAKERCPHGRPTWVAISQREIEKWFKRT